MRFLFLPMRLTATHWHIITRWRQTQAQKIARKFQVLLEDWIVSTQVIWFRSVLRSDARLLHLQLILTLSTLWILLILAFPCRILLAYKIRRVYHGWHVPNFPTSQMATWMCAFLWLLQSLQNGTRQCGVGTHLVFMLLLDLMPMWRSNIAAVCFNVQIGRTANSHSVCLQG